MKLNINEDLKLSGFQLINNRSEIEKNKCYLYAVTNGNNLLTLGKSGANGYGRLAMLMKNTNPNTHNKSFIVGMGPVIFNETPNTYFIKLLDKVNKGELAKLEKCEHKHFGISTNQTAASIFEGLKGTPSIRDVMDFIWSKFVETSLYKKAPNEEKKQFSELFKIIRDDAVRPPHHTQPKKQGDILVANVLISSGLGKYLLVWEKMCEGYFTYTDRAKKMAKKSLKELNILSTLQSSNSAGECPEVKKSNASSEAVNLLSDLGFNSEQFEDGINYLKALGKVLISSHNLYFQSTNANYQLVVELRGLDTEQAISKVSNIFTEISDKDFLLNIERRTNRADDRQFKTDLDEGSVYVVYLSRGFKNRGANYFPQE